MQDKEDFKLRAEALVEEVRVGLRQQAEQLAGFFPSVEVVGAARRLVSGWRKEGDGWHTNERESVVRLSAGFQVVKCWDGDQVVWRGNDFFRKGKFLDQIVSLEEAADIEYIELGGKFLLGDELEDVKVE